VAIGLDLSAFPLSDKPNLEDPYPPVAFVHFVRDNNTDAVRLRQRSMAQRNMA